ncbi:MAG: F0F1 ATP synthase subunit gamma [Alphaproteobacteria bacterium]|nr:F0F1 ATP synthase subunit gamma [Alphaproteobacteria bacterium]
MPSLKDLRVRIGSVRSTQKITKAMQMVAAAKLRRAQEAAESARPYSQRMERLIGSVAGNLPSLEGVPPLIVGNGRQDVHLILVVTAERGLCGSFNSAIVRRARQTIEALRREGRQVKLLCVGRKGYEALRRDRADLIVEYITLREYRNIDFSAAQRVADKVMELFAAGAFDVCHLLYSAFKSVIAQAVTLQQLVPVKLPEGTEQPDLKGAIYEYEPDEAELLATLAPRNIAVQVFKALLEGAAAEQAARMTAMDSATRNAGEMIGKLTLRYNRTRQAMITKELIEIVSGAEAL